MNDQNPDQPTSCRPSAFWPVALIALSLIFVLGRDLLVSRQQTVAMKQMVEQQMPAVTRSRQAAAGFEKMMRELLQLSKTDAEARTIAAKYGITITPPPAPPVK